MRTAEKARVIGSKCKKSYRVKDELAGKKAKCAKCNHRIKVPEPVVVEDVDLAGGTDLGSWFDDELSNTSTTPVASAVTSSVSAKKSCSACGNPLADGAVICVACGYDLRSGKKHETKKVVEKEQQQSKGKAAVKQTASLARGVIFSAIGAALGAAVWVAVAIFADLQSGWIAWGLGCAAGAGMALGHEDNDGTMAGIVAGGISILGIIGAKFFILEHFKSQFAQIGIPLDELGVSSMFGPIDGIFILLAVASAYKIGSGQATD